MSLLFANKTESDILLYNELRTFASLKKLDLYFTLDSVNSSYDFSPPKVGPNLQVL